MTISRTEKNKLYFKVNIYKKKSILNYYNQIGFSIERKQKRLERQISYIKERMEEKMIEDAGKDSNTVFIGSKPFNRV